MRIKSRRQTLPIINVTARNSLLSAPVTLGRASEVQKKTEIEKVAIRTKALSTGYGEPEEKLAIVR